MVSRRRVLTAAASAGAYRLRDRAQHVYQEAALVPRFRGVCNDGALDADAKLAALAELMDASHASCRCCQPDILPRLGDNAVLGTLTVENIDGQSVKCSSEQGIKFSMLA